MTVPEGHALAVLPGHLADRLGSLVGQTDAVVEISLSALPATSLALLSTQRIIEGFDHAAEDLVQIVLTQYGRQVIDQAAQGPENVEASGPPSTLTDELIERLAALSGQPEGVAEVAFSALRYGSLLSLVAHGIIEPLDVSREVDEIKLTARGLELIDLCAGYVMAKQFREEDPRAMGERDSARRPVVSGLSAALLREESPAIAAELAAVARFDGPMPPFTEIRDHVLSRLSQERRYRQKVVFPPLRALTRLQWVDDPHFDGKCHVHHHKLRRPGNDASVEKFISEIMSEHLDLNRPLWEVWVIDGLEEGGFIVVAKTHYALVEGLTGVELATILFDLHEHQTPPIKPQPVREPEPLPSSIEMLATSVSSSIRNAVSASRQVMRAVGAPWRAAGQAAAGLTTLSQVAAGQLATAPRSPLNVSVGPRRRVIFTDVPMSDLRLIQERLGGTHVQVALSLLAGALRSWLQADSPTGVDAELKAAVFSADGAAPGVPLHERMTQTLAPLPVNEPDPMARLASLRRSVREVSYGTDPADLTSMQELAAPTVQGLVLRLLWSSQMYNLIAANLPPVHMPLYMLGRRMTTLRPVVFLTPKHALAVGMMVFDGNMCLSVIADADAIPDLDVVASGLESSLNELLTLAKAQPLGHSRRRVRQA